MEAAEQVEKTLAEGEHLTQFEVLTVAAFLFFKEQGCDVAVVEAGLGGRLDATAIISSDVQVVTSIGLEHMELLGDTPEAILEEKAAVIQQGGRVISGPLDSAVKSRLKQICVDRAATCSFVGDEIVILGDPKSETFDVFGLYGSYTDLRLSVLGIYQRANSAAAIGAVEAFVGSELDEDQVRRALFVTEVPGRLEVISQQPLCIFDGSHNAPGMEETVRCLDQLLERRRLIAVISVLKDKESTKMLESLASRCDIIFVTQSSSPRALDANELAESMSSWQGGPEVFVDPDPRSAILSAYRLATSNQVVLVTGSLTLIADLKRELT
jgi:dihydrofolate synthase/folylpolyglutamate synthase